MAKRGVAAVVLVIVVGVLDLCEGRNYGLLCRVNDPTVVQGCNVFKDCLYEVYPVEVAQDPSCLADISGSYNRLFSLYGGPSSCNYFGKLIVTPKGQQTLVEMIKKQLLKSGFRGLEIQCDPAQAQVSQQVYASFLEFLRNQLGGGAIISIAVKSYTLEQCLINTVNAVVNFVSIPVDCGASCDILQLSSVQNLIANGLDRQKIVLDVKIPKVLTCPLNSGDCNPFSLILKTVREIEVQDLFGASLQLDRDDVTNVCGNGRFPLLRLLNVQLNGLSTAGGFVGRPEPATGCSSCNFKGYVRDTRDCSRFYTCNNGFQNQFQCPLGKSFDLCSSSCQPFYQVNCNQTTCTLTGVINGGGNAVPIPIPYPFPFPGACGGNGGNNDNNGNNGDNNGNNGNNDNNGMNGDTTNVNMTVMMEQTSELLKLMKALDLEQTVGLLHRVAKPIVPTVKNLTDMVNQVVNGLLLNGQQMDGTNLKMEEMNKAMGMLTPLLETLNSIMGGGIPLGGGGGLPGLGGALG